VLLPLSADDDVLDVASDPVAVDVSLAGVSIFEVLAFVRENHRWIAPVAARISSPGFDLLDDRVVPALVDGDSFLPSVRSGTRSDTASVAVSGAGSLAAASTSPPVALADSLAASTSPSPA
jgi:hypothetical protein